MRVFLLILVAAFLCTAAAQTPQQSGTNVVSGVILNEVTMEPIRRVAVQLTLWPDSISRLPPGTTPQSMPALATSTDAQGSFRFENLAPGAYNLTYYRQGFIGERHRIGMMTSPGGDLIEVGRGQDTTGLRYTLIPQAVLSGRVVDDEGEPVQGAQVSIMMRQFHQGKRRWLPAGGAMTNDLGEFRMPSLPPGKVLLMVQNAGFSPMAGLVAKPADGTPETIVVPTYYPGALTPNEATPIEVKAGAQVTNLQITLRRREAYRIRGRALGTDGKPLMTFHVTVHATGSEEMIQPRQFVQKPNGEFEILSVTNGSYTLRLTTTQPDSHQGGFVSEQVDVSGGDVDGVVLQTRPGATVSGFIVVEDADEKPQLGGSQVTLVSTGQSGPNYSRSTEITLENGSFTIRNVPPGRYMVRTFGSGLNGTYPARIVTGGVASRASVLEVSGTDVSDVRIVLRRDSGSVMGKTEGLDAKNGKVEQAMAVMLPVDKESMEAHGGGEMAVVIGRAGEFEFPHVPPGEYQLWVVRNYEYGAMLDAEIRQQVESKAVTVKVRAGETASVSAKPIELTVE